MVRTQHSTKYVVARLLGWLMVLSVAAIAGLLWLNKPPECLQPSRGLVGERTYESPPCMFIDERSLYEAKVVTSLGTIKIVLSPELSPVAVNAFVFLAMHDWYDGTVFHRIERTDEHAFAQAGAANPNGTGHSGFLVEHEEPSPILRYDAGVVAGVVAGTPLRFASQFFIVGEDWESINADAEGNLPIYPPLGRVFDLTSREVVQRIIQLGSTDGAPSQTVAIERIDIVRIDENEDEIPVEP